MDFDEFITDEDLLLPNTPDDVPMEAADVYSDSELPPDVENFMETAAADITHNSRLFEEDPAAMKEIQNSLGLVDFMSNKREKKQRKRKKLTLLTEEQYKQLGEANVLYSYGNYNDSLAALKELIRETPNAYEPWVTTGTIYAEMGEIAKSQGALFMAAYLNPRDPVLWKRLSRQSIMLNQTEQAIYCLTRAASADPNDIEAQWERSCLLLQEKSYSKAMAGFESIIKLCPHHIDVIKQLSKLYIKFKTPEKAIQLFENAIETDELGPIVEEDHDQEDELPEDFDGQVLGEISLGTETKANFRVGYEEIDTLVSLYIESGDHEKALMTAKKAISRLSGVTLSQNYLDSDDEIKQCRHIPLKIMAKIGICRIWLGQSHLAQDIFQVIASQLYNISNSDILYEIADAYMANNSYAKAIEILQPLVGQGASDSTFTWCKLAHCHHQLSNYETAIQLYHSILEINPNDLDSKFSLAQIYEDIGEPERALTLLREIDDFGRQEALISEENQQEEITLDQNGEIIPAVIPNRKSRKREDNIAMRVMEESKEAENKSNYAKICELFDKINDRILMTDFIRTARRLISRFANNRAFYPQDRSKIYMGAHRRRNTAQIDSEAINEALSRLNSFGIHEKATSRSLNLKDYQGLTFEQWFDAFVKLAATLSIDGRSDEAQSVLKTAFDANVFYHDEERKVQLRLHMLASSIYCKSFSKIVANLRWFINYRPLQNDMLRLYNIILSGGNDAIAAYASNPTQKFFHRQIKMVDEMSQAYSRKLGFTDNFQSPLLYCLYGHILMCAKSFTLAIEMYAKALKSNPDDPLINMCLGIAFLHRAMQRNTEDRNSQIVHVLQYYEARKHLQEAHYNIARAYHQIGLRHLALPYYETVINWGKLHGKTEEDLSKVAAYNLSLIYINSGSPALARDVLMRHCIV